MAGRLASFATGLGRVGSQRRGSWGQTVSVSAMRRKSCRLTEGFERLSRNLTGGTW